MKKNLAIILAAGMGSRFKQDMPKQFAKVSGKTVIEHTIRVFDSHSNIDGIFVIITPAFYDYFMELYKSNSWKKVKKVLNGGGTRQQSSYIGINACEDENTNLIFHDAARPFITHRIIDNVIDALNKYDAVDVAIPSSDTIIEINDAKEITKIPKRKYLYRGQTPQAFDYKIIKKAHDLALKDKKADFTDDCGLVLNYELSKVYVVNGSDVNIKITHPIDTYIADKIYQVQMTNLDNIDISKLDLKNKVIVIYGGNRGIGRAIEQICHDKNASVYCFSRRNSCDITNSNDIKNSLSEVNKKHKKIDIIINTAAILKLGKLAEDNSQEIDYQIRLNYSANLYVAKESYQYLRKTKGLLLFFTSSSYTRGRALYSLYSSSKAAVVNLTQALSEEWMQDGIRVNVICPERTATAMRSENFGYEDPNTLLDPKKVAAKTIALFNMDITGQVIDVRRSDSD
jgi:ribitol-5-phosphate 2-dehydrogenase (NADP+) / D-ribitol-5-phosphate cytidylyltransferase